MWYTEFAKTATGTSKRLSHEINYRLLYSCVVKYAHIVNPQSIPTYMKFTFINYSRATLV